MRNACFALCLQLCACVDVPKVNDTITPMLEKTNYPKLVPLTPLITNSVPAGIDSKKTTKNLEARILALKTRARALKNR